jgi:hypothetical protein
MAEQPGQRVEPDAAKCDPFESPGPVREGGGTTGEGNLSPQQASRTGGATGGVGTDEQAPSRAGTIPPSA